MRPHLHSPIFLLLLASLLLSGLDSCSVFQTPQASTGTETTGTKSARTRPGTTRRGTDGEATTARPTRTRPNTRRGRNSEEMEADAKPMTYSATSSTAQLDYLKTYKDAAVMEMNQGGIPASIILAQGLIESAAGQSELAQQANNHFGIKCAGSWTGRTFYKQDDDRDEDGKPIKSCFRVYNSVAEGFHDHGEFLRDPKKHNRYGFLFNLDRTDYKSWAKGLQSAGYATSQTYATQLIDIIERFKIYEYDRPGATSGVLPIPGTNPTSVGGTNPGNGSSTTPDPNNPYNVPVIPPAQRIGRVNDVKVVLTRPGETLDDVAKLYRLSTLKVADYNDRGYTPGIKLKENTRVFIQAKREQWRGRSKDHYVQNNQTMFEISQLYGVQIEKLLSRNDLRYGQEPATGERIVLKGARRKGDAVALRDPSLPGSMSSTATTSTPTTMTPVVQPPKRGQTTTVNDDELFEIQGNQTSVPSTTQPPVVPPVPTSTPPKVRPSVSDVPYPSDPVPQTGNNNNNTWSQPTTTTYPPAVTPAPMSAGNGYHLVVKGDTLYNISRKYNLSLAQLKQMNNMTGDENIRIGQTLRVR